MRRCQIFVALIGLVTPSMLLGQNHASGDHAASMGHATGKVEPAARQIAEAVTAAPEDMRAGATVLGYSADKKLVQLRKGTNDMICLADDPSLDGFHVACYHKSLEAFMARGRELRAQGIDGAKRDSIRNADVTAGKIKMPAVGALYTLTGPEGSFDPKTGEAKDAQPLHSVYIPMATTASTGLPEKPTPDSPWIMSPGTPRAHIMFGTHQHH